MEEKESIKRAGEVESEQVRSGGFTGTVSLQLADLVQMVCLCRADLAIYVRSGAGSGSVLIRGGSIRHAQTEELQGEEAFYRILEWKDGHFDTKPINDAEDIVSITKHWEHLLLEIARRRDEESGTRRPLKGEILFEQIPSGSIDSMDNAEIAEPDPSGSPLSAPFNNIGESEGSGPAMAADLVLADAGRAVRVLIVDDSAFFARRMKDMMEAEPGIEVIGIAGNGQEALDFLAANPSVDLITLDIRMPVMEGDTTLKHIMIRHPIPALIISGLDSGDLGKVFEFLHVGAVDFLQKPGPRDDVKAYAKKLRAMVKRASRADTSRFRRRRMPRNARACRPAGPSAGSPGRDVLVIAGAEGAYVDWFRLPIAELCRQGLVIGLQQLSKDFVAKLCRLISEGTSAKVEPLPPSGRLSSGTLFFGNATARVNLKADWESGSLEVNTESREEETDWDNGLKIWLDQLSLQYRERLSVYLLSAAHSLDSFLIDNVLDHGGRFILSPADAVMCADLVKSVEDYMLLYPEQVVWGSPEQLPAIWSKVGSNE